MATALDPALTKKSFTNWLKGALAVLFAREGLTDFVLNEISDFQRDLLHSIFTQHGISSGTTCSSCTTANMLKCPTQDFCDRNKPCKQHDPNLNTKTPNKKCPRNICHNIRDAILQHHRFHGPSWQITDATRWCSDAFQIAKCYLPPKGYDNKSSFDEIDFNGTLGVIISNTRFQNQMTAQLNKTPNICSRVREMVNESIRHSANYELSDAQLVQCIDGLRDLLQDTKVLLNDQHAKDAVNKLNQLQNNTLVITAGDITKVLDENVSERISDQQREAIQAINDHLTTVQKESVRNLERIIDEKLSAAIIMLQKETEQHIDAIKKSADMKKPLYGFWDRLTRKPSRQRSVDLYKAAYLGSDNQVALKEEFKQELVRLYNEKESMIPASPLVEDFAVPLTELYVQPPMSAFIKPNAFGQEKQHSEKKPISSYRELFLNDDNVPYKNIYVEANAGFGKTSFTQMVALTWCQAHMPNKLMKSSFKMDDVETLKRFDFLFLLHLREFQGDTCNLDELIFKFVSQSLPSREQFSEQLIANMLHTKTCLVIIDGLDEWLHPETCTRTPEIPHNNYRANCTVLTTTRPWKLSTIGLPPNLIDRHIEITELDYYKSEKLKSNAVKLLCENRGTLHPNLTDFDRKVSSVELGDIRLIPYILLQLICIWFDGLSIGNSKCETYSNTIELTLKRGLNKKNAPTLPTGTAERNVTVPACMRHNVLCKQYVNLLLKLGELAFYALFQNIKKFSLVIESTTVLNFLTEQEIEFCLKIGLLSQSKDRSKVAVKRYNVFFQHKSIQEFMAALYITCKWNNTTIKPTILEVCSSLSSILEMENLFVFVCGMNPLVYTCISGELQKIVDVDSVTSRIRTDIYIGFDTRTMSSDQIRQVEYEDTKTMASYQSMQVQCLQESVRNGNDNCLIYLCDIQINHYSIRTEAGLKTIINLNKRNVKSLCLLDPDKIAAFMQSLDPGVFTSLETLKVERCDKELVWLADILTGSARTLKCLTLSGYSFKNPSSLSDISITALTGLTCLQSFDLNNVYMTHSNLKCFYDCISQTTTLIKLTINAGCSDHRFSDCDVTLDLQRLVKLKMLYLYVLPCRELHVNTECLEKFKFRPTLYVTMTARASAMLWQDLRAAPVLSSLKLYDISSSQEMMETIPTLTQLQHLELVRINMFDITLRVSPKMTQLESVVLEGMGISSAALRTLFLSFGQLRQSINTKLRDIFITRHKWRELFLIFSQLPHPVTVELVSCWGLSRKAWKKIVKMIKTTPTLSILQDLSFDDGYASLTLKTKTV